MIALNGINLGRIGQDAKRFCNSNKKIERKKKKLLINYLISKKFNMWKPKIIK
jgi:hypothetical protein